MSAERSHGAPDAADARRSGGDAPWSPRAPRLLVTGRVLVLAVAAALTVAAFTAVRPRAAGAGYRCPMHPEAAAAAPGACSICGMALVAAGRAAPVPDPRHEAHVDRARRRVFGGPVRGPAWVDATGAVIAAVYRDDLVGVAPGQPATFSPSAAPSSGAAVQWSGDPATAWDGAIVHARFTPAGPAAPAPGSEGWLTIALVPRELLVVPSSAILRAPDGPYVLVRAGDGHGFARRPVQVGRAHPGATAILSGLRDGEQVAVVDAFFVDAELGLAAGGSR